MSTSEGDYQYIVRRRALKDTLESLGQDARAFELQITKYPDFEHLEAKARVGTDK